MNLIERVIEAYGGKPAMAQALGFTNTQSIDRYKRHGHVSRISAEKINADHPQFDINELKNYKGEKLS